MNMFDENYIERKPMGYKDDFVCETCNKLYADTEVG